MPKHTQNNKGGGIRSLFRKTRSTKSHLRNLGKTIDSMRLKNITEQIDQNVIDLSKQRELSIDECLKKCTDPEMCNQLKHMITTKPDYEWGNLCANSFHSNASKKYLKTYMSTQMMVEHLAKASDQAQKTMKAYEEKKSKSKSLTKRITKIKSKSKSKTPSVHNPLHNYL